MPRIDEPLAPPWVPPGGMNPRHPVYVISKGRWDSRKTVRALDAIRVPHRVVVEPQEHAAYAAAMDPARLLVLPFSNLGLGSIPARNWVWEHALASGASHHWILDDNISGFYRLHRNLKCPVGDGSTFLAAERFVDRFSNVGQAGMNYFMFAPRKSRVPPLYLNTRVYSCILLRNNLPFRWRGRYNEDTDLSLRILKHGLCTVLFNAFLAFKETTMTMRGGNTDELYRRADGRDGRLEMARSLQVQHPDVVTVVRRWNRWQHSVDYRPFARNRLIRVAEGHPAPALRLQVLRNGAWTDAGDGHAVLPGADEGARRRAREEAFRAPRLADLGWDAAGAASLAD